MVNNFTVFDSIHGKFIVNRHCDYQAEALIKTGATHIEHELRNILPIVKLLPRNPVVVDAGANVGFVTIPIANAIRQNGGIVHAFEVQRMLYYALCGSVALNDLDNVRVYHCGLGKASGALKVPAIDYGRPQDFGMVSLVDQEKIVAHETVQLSTIDELGLQGLDLLKIDVEGMEIDVLRGAHESLRRFRPWCWIEYWMVEKELLKQQFEELDYEMFVMDQLNILCAPREKLVASGLTVNAPLF
ncbi:MAG: FkbM family methyltransferase [Chlorobiaceae bacterium]|nr:FkbM family methyltransferase [Chlorobiaceae bacterium]